MNLDFKGFFYNPKSSTFIFNALESLVLVFHLFCYHFIFFSDVGNDKTGSLGIAQLVECLFSMHSINWVWWCRFIIPILQNQKFMLYCYIVNLRSTWLHETLSLSQKRKKMAKLVQCQLSGACHFTDVPSKLLIFIFVAEMTRTVIKLQGIKVTFGSNER